VIPRDENPPGTGNSSKSAVEDLDTGTNSESAFEVPFVTEAEVPFVTEAEPVTEEADKFSLVLVLEDGQYSVRKVSRVFNTVPFFLVFIFKLEILPIHDFFKTS
jgi:hypothetical protein